MRDVFSKSIWEIFFFALLLQPVPAGLYAQDETTKLKSVSGESSKQPTAEKVISDFVDALGGEMAISSIEGFELKGKFSSPSMAGTIRVHGTDGKAATSLKYEVAEGPIPHEGVLQYGCDGDFLWKAVQAKIAGHDPVPSSEVNESKSESRRRSTNLAAHCLAKECSLFDGEVTVERKTKIREREVWELKFVHNDPEDRALGIQHRFFDAESGLLLKSIRKSSDGESPPLVEQYEYFEEAHAGVLFWSKRTVLLENETSVFEFDKVEIDPEFPEGAFDVPVGGNSEKIEGISDE